MDKFTMVFYYSLNDEVMANIQAMKPHAINCGAGIIPPLLLLSLLSFPPSSLLASFSVRGGDGEELLDEFVETKKSGPSFNRERNQLQMEQSNSGS